MLFICAMKMAATASYNAVPSMLIVAPIGKTKRVTRQSIPLFSSKHRNVIGSVAALCIIQKNKLMHYFLLNLLLKQNDLGKDYSIIILLLFSDDLEPNLQVWGS